MNELSVLHDLVAKNEDDILRRWVDRQLGAASFRADRISKAELSDQSRRFLSLFRQSLASGNADLHAPAWAGIREMLEDLSGSRAQQGFSPSETALFIFSLKETLFERLQDQLATDPKAATQLILDTNQVLDRIGLFTTEVYQRGRERVIIHQQQELMELSTPVVTLWEGVLALPIIGTLDSSRTQVVMESLLQRIVETGAAIAIIDITGVPTVDTLTAQHLLKTVAAARLMGADCIISGIRPQIAQTIVHLGVDLGTVVTKSTLADAFAIALRRLNLSVTRVAAPKKRRPDGDEADRLEDRVED